jgi:hypothetical protein
MSQKTTGRVVEWPFGIEDRSFLEYWSGGVVEYEKK